MLHFHQIVQMGLALRKILGAAEDKLLIHTVFIYHPVPAAFDSREQFVG